MVSRPEIRSLSLILKRPLFSHWATTTHARREPIKNAPMIVEMAIPAIWPSLERGSSLLPGRGLSGVQGGGSGAIDSTVHY